MSSSYQNHPESWSLPANGRVVVVGASLAGLRTVEALRTTGFSGPVTLLGDEHVKPYDRPPLSKQFLLGSWDHDRIELRNDGELAALSIDLRLGVFVSGVDTQAQTITTLVDGVASSLPYDALIIASGVRARSLSHTLVDPGIQKPTVRTIRTRTDSEALQPLLVEGARVVIIGAGFIGAEVAAAASTKGATVTIVEQLPIALARALGDEMGAACGSLHARHGVTLRCGVEVVAITEGCVFLGDGSTLAADVVVAGIGTIPNTEWLIDSGIDITNGVLVDGYCRAISTAGTVLDGVFAVGDVARFPLPWPHEPHEPHEQQTEKPTEVAPFTEDPSHFEPSATLASVKEPLQQELVGARSLENSDLVRIEHWTNAAEMANHVAGVLHGDWVPYTPVPYFWSDQYNHKIQFLGRAGQYDEVRIVAGSVEDGAWLALYRIGDRLSAALGVSKVRALAPYRMLLEKGCSWDEALDAAPHA